MSLPPRETQSFTDASRAADLIIERAGPKIVLGLPLGLGKANLIANALYARAAADPALSLTILTALTLEVPKASSSLEKRFLNPIRERLFEGVPELAYAQAIRNGQLPDNIQVHEFFLLAGQWLNAPSQQQNYISVNYTEASEVIMARGVNVVAQMMAREDDRVSLSCNADLLPDFLKARGAGRADFILVGEINNNLPFMEGEANIPAAELDIMLEGPETQYRLYGPPKLPIDDETYAAGLAVSQLIEDGGTLQIGIGSMGDAIAQSLILRHKHNAAYQEICAHLSEGRAQDYKAHNDIFSEGLFGLSEMLTDGFIPLIDAEIVKREVDGVILQGGFFLGPQSFYQRLKTLPIYLRQKIEMRPISWINALYKDETKKRAQRVKARFVNSAMMATPMGAIVSDGLEDGRVISGVGGQYDFVAQAGALDDALSIICLNATRLKNGQVHSNIVWAYGHLTIPRHLRDIVATEYGAVNLRGKTDAECIMAMLSITDARFQDDLLRQAKQAGKIADNYELPSVYKLNTPSWIKAKLAPLRASGLITDFPFGTDFTKTEQILMPALNVIKNASSSKRKLAKLIAQGVGENPKHHTECLTRMGLEKPQKTSERLERLLILGALKKPYRNRVNRKNSA
ncbi:MAG: acetyl-CoA hydrolase/transferase C-terminal domain-containing protein [Hellea sp.]